MLRSQFLYLLLLLLSFSSFSSEQTIPHAKKCRTVFAEFLSSHGVRAAGQSKIPYNDKDITIRISETGAGFSITKKVLELTAKDSRLNIDEAVSTYSREATDIRYSAKALVNTDYITEDRIRTQLNREYRFLRTEPQERQLAIASTAFTDRENGFAWIGVKYGANKTDPPIETLVKINLPPGSSASQQTFIANVAHELATISYSTPPSELVGALMKKRQEFNIQSLRLDKVQYIELAPQIIKDTKPIVLRPSRSELEKKILEESKGIADYKARDLNLHGNLKSAILELGDDLPSVSQTILSAPFSGTVYNAQYVSDLRKIQATNLGDIKRLLEIQYLSVKIPRESHFLKKVGFVKKVAVEGDKKFLTMGVKGIQTDKDSLIFKLEVPSNISDEALGTLSMNFFYAFYKYPKEPERFMKSLNEGVENIPIFVKEFQITGDNFKELNKHID